MRRKWRALSSVVLVAGLVGLGLVSAAEGEPQAAAAKKSAFKPKKIAGNWSGSWFNETFKTSGPAEMKLLVKGKGKRQKMIGIFDLGGNAFGCPDPDPRKVTLKKGKGRNTWSKKGFSATWNNGFGKAKLSYKYKKQKLKGSGVSPCGADIAFTYSGKMTTKRIKANVDITLGGDPFATSKLRMKKG
jgi:hypothetical protein